MGFHTTSCQVAISQYRMSWRWILNFIAPPLCAECSWPGKWLCKKCHQYVEYCLGPAYFREPLSGLTQVWCIAKYAGPVTKLIQQMKFGVCCPDIADWLGNWLAQRVTLTHLAPPILVSWVPCSPRNKQARGFDQAERIARVFAQRYHLPCEQLLCRNTSISQHQLHTKSDRQLHAKGMFRLRAPPYPDFKTLLLIDDVCTTGQTLSQAAVTITNSLRVSVIGLAVARD